jgi:hypothetical protein
MKPLTAALFAISLSFAAAGAQAEHRRDTFAWNELAIDLAAQHQPPPIQTHTLALVHIAMHDALNAIHPRFAPYAFGGRMPYASVRAALAAAARDTLIARLPPAADAIEQRYAATLAAIPEGPRKDAGLQAGQAAAAAILAQRGSDPLEAAIGKPYTPGAPEPGVYQPTAPVVLLAGWSEIAPFALTHAAQFRSPPPPAISSAAYRRDYAEVKLLGSAASTARTATQTETARFWFDVATKEWHRAAQQGLAASSADEWEAARVFALVAIAMADAVIATFDTKFHFNYWRPVTAIRAGDVDGNPETPGDAQWQPLCATPPFPEYTSTHAATGAAAARVLALAIGDRHPITVASPTLPGATRVYRSFRAAAEDEAVSRIYCGIHFRSGMNAGLAQGHKVAQYVFDAVLRPVHRAH